MNPENNLMVKDYDTLLKEHCARRQATTHDGFLIQWHELPDGKDSYNPSGPFTVNNEVYMWGRVESRDAQDAVAVLFKQRTPEIYEHVEGVIPLPIEDPFTTTIGSMLIVGGVEIEKDEHGRVTNYRTVFYKGTSVNELHPFSVGPSGMKDIRFINYNKKILVFTRPHIPVGARYMGRIAYTTIDSLDELTAERLAVEFTEILPNMFTDTEWGGVNDLYHLDNGLIGVLAHIAKFDDAGKRHYAAVVFVFNPFTNNSSPLYMIAERGDFPMGPVKIMPENLNRPEMHDDLADVVFSSRLWNPSGEYASTPTLELTCGLSDAAAGTITIENPFPHLIKEYFPNN